MPWARKDDKANSNAKLLALSDGAYRMFDCGLTYAANSLSEGFIPDYALRTFGVRAPIKKCVDELCSVLVEGKKPLWYRVKNGYRVNDYLDWNDPREVVEKKREKGRERLKKFRERLNGNGAQMSVTKRVTERVSQRDPERVLFAVPVPQEIQVQERTAPPALPACGNPVENPAPRKLATPWKRVIAITHAVMDAEPDSANWSSEIKARCRAQGIDYAAPGGADQRPLYARAVDYVEQQRKRRRAH